MKKNMSNLSTGHQTEDRYSPSAGVTTANELTVVSLADGSEQLLKSFTSDYSSLQGTSFSPDGRFVAFSLVREGNPPHGDLLLMTADGRNEDSNCQSSCRRSTYWMDSRREKTYIPQ